MTTSQKPSSARALRGKMASAGLVRVMATHSPLSARLAEEAGFDGLWASGFELSALYGLADVSLISMTQHLDMVRAMVIYGNHAIRAAVTAMQDIFARIIADGGIYGVDSDIVPVDEIFRLQRMDQIKAAERKFLR